mmetsp:Transcript_50934/g.145500  ORF Transcript_50934/g.145500 Transcript_50934/m.145500 type:complete len:226 (+) Transcript_50934:199-876(+)
MAGVESIEKAREMMEDVRQGQLGAGQTVALEDLVEVVWDVLEDQLILYHAHDLEVLELHDIAVGEIPQQRNFADYVGRHAVTVALVEHKPLERNPLVGVAIPRQEDGTIGPTTDDFQRLVPLRHGRSIRLVVVRLVFQAARVRAARVRGGLVRCPDVLFALGPGLPGAALGCRRLQAVRRGCDRSQPRRLSGAGLHRPVHAHRVWSVAQRKIADVSRLRSTSQSC